MGYNINDTGGDTGGGVDIWTATLDLGNPAVTTVSGDFDVVPLFGGSNSEATDGYTFSALSNPALGSLTFDTTDGTYTFTVDRAAVFAAGGDQVVSFTVTGASGSDSDTDTVQITILVCVARGTRIETPDGPKPVESLLIGDLVSTLDGPPQPVRWIGSRPVTRAEMKADPSLWPVRIAKGALGDDAPSRDLLVSPQHRVFLQDWRAELLFGAHQVLVPAKALINDHSITREKSVSEVEYFHLLFDNHEVIFTEGAATESFHPGQYTLSALEEEVRDSLLTLFPELGRPGGEGDTARTSLKPWETRLLALSADPVSA